MVRNLPTVQETWVQSLGQEDLEKGMATHSSILAWRIPWTKEPGGLQSTGSQSGTTELLSTRDGSEHSTQHAVGIQEVCLKATRKDCLQLLL